MYTSNSSNTVVHFGERQESMFIDANKDAHNLYDSFVCSVVHPVKFSKVFTNELN